MKKSLRVFLSMFSVLAVSAFSMDALACSCMGISNAQQAAQGKNMVVAKVTTQTVDQNTGLGTLNIEKVYKGNVTAASLEVQGQDGANCGSDIFPPSAKSWVAIFAQDNEGNYMAGCADGSLKIDATGNINFYLGGKQVSVTEQELSDLVNLKAIPSVKGLSCSVAAGRTYIDNSGGTQGLPNIDYYENVTGSAADPFNVEVTKDFSSEGLPNLFVANGWAGPAYQDPLTYHLFMNVTEPFFAVSTSQSTAINIAETSYTNYVGLSSYKDANGISKSDFGADPFYGYSASIQCELLLDMPLVQVQ